MSGATILVVDDDDAIRTLVTKVLVRERFEVEQASNGEQALTKLRAGAFGTVVLDLMMPVLSGFEVIQYLETHDDAGAPRIIVVSAASEGDVERARSPSVCAVLRKPFGLSTLVAAVRACSDG